MTGHGGNIRELAAIAGCDPSALLDFSANINPLGPPPGFRQAVAEALNQVTRYPEPDAASLRQALAARHGLDEGQVVVGNGSSELLFALPAAAKPGRVILPVPCYIDYHRAFAQAGYPVIQVPLAAKNHFIPDLSRLDQLLQPGDLLVLGQPSNPTGALVGREELLGLIRKRPDAQFLLDEAFAGFLADYQSLACCADNLITLCSLTKLYAIPGLRLGYLCGRQDLCRSLQEGLPPWSVNGMAQSVGLALLAEQEYLSRSREMIARNRAQLARGLAELPGITVYPGSANYLFLRIDRDQWPASRLCQVLLRRFRIAVRDCGNYQGLEGEDAYLRIAVRSAEDNHRLLAALVQVLNGRSLPDTRAAKRARALMLQGTGSDVGKSVLAAGLCRILLQDGIRVAPFKAQNMSLNSFVTRDGGEMGRAQVVQAQACRLDPDVRMNPVLLKPSSEVGSQVIVLGRPVGSMRAADYIGYKKILWRQVRETYDSLASEHEVMILEGAGSPGEVNLKAHDLVNMRMAAHARAPVLLTGDIDRGGVYASFIGHVAVMEDWERELLAGFVVNRFRGDQSLLADAHDTVRQRTGRPVFGVVPYLDNLGLPQEDSVSFKAGLFQSAPGSNRDLDIALIDLPHISNFTDLEPLLDEEDVALRMVRSGKVLGRPDAIVVPGSKNVLADLDFLEQSGLREALLACATCGVELVGICGGFQMLGQTIHDPHGLESAAGSCRAGLGLLDLDTVLEQNKTLLRRKGKHLPSGLEVRGYEIHHGQSTTHGQPILDFDRAFCGLAGGEGRIWGSYLHGIFDADAFRHYWLNRLRERKGLPVLSKPRPVYDLEPALDRLAAVLRQSLDMDAIRRLLRL